MAQDHHINISLLDEITKKCTTMWYLFSEAEFISSVNKCNNLSTPRPDKLSWRHLKSIIKDNACLKKIINIADACFELGHWLSQFKVSTSIIISKPNKKLYDFPKSFRPIILLNMIGKLIEKVISKRLQFQLISNNFIHLSQLGGLKQCSTTNAGIVLTHFIHTSWVKNNMISTLAFNITQFFPSLNHQLLLLVFNKAGFDPKVSLFFRNYLVRRKTQYFWNNFSSSFCNVDVGVSQGLALSPILSALYIAPVLHILEK